MRNLRAIVAPVTLSDPGSMPGWSSGLGRWRAIQSSGLVASIGVLWMAAGCFAFRRVRATPWFGPLSYLSVATLMTYALVEWGGSTRTVAWLITAPMSLVILVAAVERTQRSAVRSATKATWACG